MKLTAIVAVADNGVIGLAGQLPWHLPADLAHFKMRTLGKPVLMGRRTFASVGKPLPGRLNVVVTREPAPEGCLAARTLSEALDLPGVADAPEVMIIGGAQLYTEALPFCDELLLTRVHHRPEGDTYLDVDLSGWVLADREERPADARNPYAMAFETWKPSTSTPSTPSRPR
jgi:dihydrofolate reductase